MSRKKIILLISSLVLITAGVLIVLTSVRETTSQQNSGENKMQSNNPFPFKNQGELSFLGKGEKVISTIDIEVAANEDSREQGLMFRTSMEENRGMLFIFDAEELHAFWMKNTIIPLDILFINANKEIIKIHKNTMPFQESPSYDSEGPAKYVVEVNAGYCDKYKISRGDKISFTLINKN